VTLYRAAERWAFVAGLVALTAYAVADSNAVVFALGLPAAVIAWIVTRGTPSKALPRALINVLLFVAVAWATLSLFSEGLGIGLFSEFVSSLMVIKLLDRRGCRDTAQILMLSVFLVIGAVLTSNSFWLGVLCVAFLPVTRRPVTRRVGLVVSSSLVIASIVFVLMPREIGSKTLGSWGAPSVGQVVGFNDEVRLGLGGLISESQEPVLDVQIFDRESEPVGTVGQRFYLRGAVLDRYDLRDGSWTRSDVARKQYQAGPPPMTRPREQPVTGGVPRNWNLRQEVTIRNIASERGHLFSIWQVNQVRVDPPARLEFCSDDGALRVTGHSGKVSYTAFSNDRNPAPARWEEPTEEDRLGVYIDLPRVAEVARGLLVDAGIEPDPLARSAVSDTKAVRTLQNHFTAGRFRYTLETVSAPPGRDPVEWFLTDSREGHCEYYASALAIMCRTVGIDARVITGYVATDYNENSSSYIVRASNAHAWVEAEVLPGYWTTFDPTPSADLTRIHEPPRGLLADARRFFDTLEFAWIRTVVGYDADSRSELLGPTGAETSVFPMLERIGNTLEQTQSATQFTLLRAGRNALIAFCVAVMLAALFARERRRLARLLRLLLRAVLGALLGRRGTPPEPGDVMHAGLLDAFARAGCAKPAWVPLRTHTRRVVESGVIDPEPGAAAARLADRIYAAFFAGRAIGDDEMRAAAVDLETIRAWSRAGRGRPDNANGRPDPNGARDPGDQTADDEEESV